MSEGVVLNPTRLVLAALIGLVILLVLIIKFNVQAMIAILIGAICIGLLAGMPTQDIVDLPPNIFVFFDARHPHDTPGRDRACDAYRENQMSTGAFRHFHQTYPGIPALIFYIRLMSYVYVHNLTFFCTFCNTCLKELYSTRPALFWQH